MYRAKFLNLKWVAVDLLGISKEQKEGKLSTCDPDCRKEKYEMQDAYLDAGGPYGRVLHSVRHTAVRGHHANCFRRRPTGG